MGGASGWFLVRRASSGGWAQVVPVVLLLAAFVVMAVLGAGAGAQAAGGAGAGIGLATLVDAVLSLVRLLSRSEGRQG